MAREDATTRFYRLFWPWMPTVLRTARFLTRDGAEAEDLAQETMMKAFRFTNRFEEGTDAKSWLMAILRNTRIDRLRAAGKALQDVSLEQLDTDFPDPGAPETPSADASGPLTPEQILNDFSDQTLIDGLQHLPEEIRFTLLLVDVQQLDHAQAADVLGVPVGTVKSRAHRGRGMLRAYLETAHAATGGGA